MKDVLAAIRDRVRSANAHLTPLCLSGSGSKDFYGQSLEGERLDLRAYAGVVDYDPSELVITVRCGTPLAELERVLADRNQYLAFEPPHFGPGATVGGMVAAGLAGPRRQAAGAVRDFVLGARMMDATGEVFTFGGQVMKNVAGFDVARLAAGSLGTLGPILEVSLKTLPRPPFESSLKLEMPQAKALESLNRWAGRPLPVSASAWFAGDLYIRLSGAEAAVRAAAGRIGGEALLPERARALWTGIREQTEPFFAAATVLWRLSVPSTSPPLELPGEQLIEWGGALRWLATNADARTVREIAARTGGHATLFRSTDKSAGVFHPLDPVLARLNTEVKRRFDPAGIFNRARMYAN